MHLFIEKLANHPAPILITGETGTGKSVTAKNIFECGHVYHEKFLTLNLATVSENLIESELFGHKKGSFTGASNDKKGYLETVGTGVLFLDEIGELSLSSQKKLLAVLEERMFVPVGETTPRVFKGKIIAATNRDLKQLVEKGEFREDLLYRLMVFTIHKQPLRKVKDFPGEVRKVLRNMGEKRGMPDNLLDVLQKHHWAGNYRELKNCLEYMQVASGEGEFKMEHLPKWFSHKQEKENSSQAGQYTLNYYETFERFEKNYLEYALKELNGEINRSAKRLGISKVSLITKIRKYGIDINKIKFQAYQAA